MADANGWLVWPALAAVALGLTVGALALLGRARWARETGDLADSLPATRLPPLPGRYHANMLEGLPALVQRYLGEVLREGQAMVLGARMQQTGSFNLKAKGPQWLPFSAEQQVQVRRPGFLWNARMAMLPGLTVFVHDAYVGGTGTLHALVLGLWSMARQQGPGEIARGELMRYLSETPWYPTALLPGQGVTWAAVDAHSADATLVDGDIRLTLRFHFGPDGMVRSIRSPGHGTLLDGRMVLAPRGGCMANYQERAGMRVPLSGEAAWAGAEGDKPYIRLVITTLDDDLAPD